MSNSASIFEVTWRISADEERGLPAAVARATVSVGARALEGEWAVEAVNITVDRGDFTKRTRWAESESGSILAEWSEGYEAPTYLEFLSAPTREDLNAFPENLGALGGAAFATAKLFWGGADRAIHYLNKYRLADLPERLSRAIRDFVCEDGQGSWRTPKVEQAVLAK